MPRSPEGMSRAIIANLPAKTGRPLEEWVALVRAQGLSSRKERIDWLKTRHGLGHVQAQVVAGESEKPDDWAPLSPEATVDAQYAGERARLRPIYERIATFVRSLGEDAYLEPRKTYVTLSRRRQFGLVQPATRDRVSVGLVLPGLPVTERLVASKGLGSERFTHRVDLSRPDDVDDELRGWLRAAYEADAG